MCSSDLLKGIAILRTKGRQEAQYYKEYYCEQLFHNDVSCHNPLIAGLGQIFQKIINFYKQLQSNGLQPTNTTNTVKFRISSREAVGPNQTPS